MSAKINQPIECAMCHKAQIFEVNERELVNLPDSRYYVLKRCGNINCLYPQLLFYSAIFRHSSTDYQLEEIIPFKIISKKFSDYIKALSPDFVKLYQEAKTAERNNLISCAGMCYRKSLEFLLKDYLVAKFETDEDEIDKIKSLYLNDLINKYFGNKERILHAAKFTAWIGNDYTHYEKKKGLDISDIKDLLDIILLEFDSENKMESYKLKFS